MPGVSHRMQAGIYWPPSPTPFQNPSNPFSPQDQSTGRSIPGTPGTPYLTNILNLRTDEFTGLSPTPIPSTPIPSAEHLFDASASNIDASIGFGDKGLDDMIIEQYPFNFPEWFSYDTNTDFLSMEMGPGLIAETLNGHQNLRSVMAPPLRRRFKEEQENDYKIRLRESESLHGPEHPTTLEIHLGLAEVFVEQGRYRSAELSFRQVASTSQRFLGNDHELTFNAVRGLLYTFFGQGRYSIAETHYRSLHRRALTVLGREHHLTLNIALNMASLLSQIGQFNEAVLLKREVFEIWSKKYGLEYRGTINAMQNLAISLLHLKQVEEGERLLRQAIRFYEKVRPDDVNIPYGKSYLAWICAEQGRYEESEKMQREVLSVLRSSLGPEHPNTLRAMGNLVKILNVQKRHAESRKMNLEILVGRIKVLGPNHPDTTRVQRALVSILTLVSTQEANITTYRVELKNSKEESTRSRSH